MSKQEKAPTAAEEVVAAKLLNIMDGLRKEKKSNSYIVEQMRKHLRDVAGFNEYQH